jgi:membrane protein YqaA with SNARE-associated domain
MARKHEQTCTTNRRKWILNIGLGALFLAGFVASTLLPGGSEPLLMVYLAQQAPVALWPQAALVVLVMGVGNTLGGVATYGMGRGGRYVFKRLRQEVDEQRSSHRKAKGWLERWGPWALLMSWVPIVGDPLCLAAGAMKLSFGRCVVAMVIGKFARYVMLIAAFMAVQGP